MSSQQGSFFNASSGVNEIQRFSTFTQASFVMDETYQERTKWVQHRYNCFRQVKEYFQKKEFSQALESLKAGYIKSFAYANQKFLDGCVFTLKELYKSIIQQLMLLTLYKQTNPRIHQIRTEFDQYCVMLEEDSLTNEMFKEMIDSLEQLDQIRKSLDNTSENDQLPKINLRSKLSFVTNSLERKKTIVKDDVGDLNQFSQGKRVVVIDENNPTIFHFNITNNKNFQSQKRDKQFSKDPKTYVTEMKNKLESKFSLSSLQKKGKTGLVELMNQRNEEDDKIKVIRI